MCARVRLLLQMPETKVLGASLHCVAFEVLLDTINSTQIPLTTSDTPLRYDDLHWPGPSQGVSAITSTARRYLEARYQEVREYKRGTVDQRGYRCLKAPGIFLSRTDRSWCRTLMITIRKKAQMFCFSSQLTRDRQPANQYQVV